MMVSSVLHVTRQRSYSIYIAFWQIKDVEPRHGPTGMCINISKIFKFRSIWSCLFRVVRWGSESDCMGFEGWRIESLELHNLLIRGGTVFCVALSPDGNKVAFTSPIYREVVIYDLTTQSGNILENPPNDFAVLSWSSTGYLATASGDYGIRIWDQSGQCKMVIMGHTEQIWSVAWSHDGSRIASASLDNTGIVWNAVTASCELKLDLKYVGHFHFDPSDSNKLYTGSGTFLLGPHLQKNPTRGSLPEPGTYLKPMSYGLSSDGAWVTYQGINLLRLPPEYRPGH
ncbi:hypothetical protein N7488_001797 [Penicillium malachiteum]|nr:hypothetical protein N7488_001797 [Penicillium malachiteum]